jgi:hypothetical protein
MRRELQINREDVKQNLFGLKGHKNENFFGSDLEFLFPLDLRLQRTILSPPHNGPIFFYKTSYLSIINYEIVHNSKSKTK